SSLLCHLLLERCQSLASFLVFAKRVLVIRSRRTTGAATSWAAGTAAAAGQGNGGFLLLLIFVQKSHNLVVLGLGLVVRHRFGGLQFAKHLAQLFRLFGRQFDADIACQQSQFLHQSDQLALGRRRECSRSAEPARTATARPATARTATSTARAAATGTVASGGTTSWRSGWGTAAPCGAATGTRLHHRHLLVRCLERARWLRDDFIAEPVDQGD